MEYETKKEELIHAAQVLLNLSKLPIFQRNNGDEYNALLISAQYILNTIPEVGDIDLNETIPNVIKQDSQICNLYEDKVMKQPTMTLEGLKYIEINTGWCNKVHTACDCGGRVDKCTFKGF